METFSLDLGVYAASAYSSKRRFVWNAAVMSVSCSDYCLRECMEYVYR